MRNIALNIPDTLFLFDVVLYIERPSTLETVPPPFLFVSRLLLALFQSKSLFKKEGVRWLVLVQFTTNRAPQKT